MDFKEIFFISLLWVLSTEPNVADEALRHLVSYKEILKGTKKLWHKYLRRYLCNVIEHMLNYHFSDHFPEVLKVKLHHCKKLMKYSHKVTTYDIHSSKRIKKIKEISGGVAMEDHVLLKREGHSFAICQFQNI